MDQKCSINVRSLTHRLADCDGRSCKAAIDGIVDSGILANDSPEFVKKVCQEQEKLESQFKEQTIITLTWD